MKRTLAVLGLLTLFVACTPEEVRLWERWYRQDPEAAVEYALELDERTESGDDFTGVYDDEVTESYGWTVWDDLAECESGGDWGISTGNGYYGGLQFSLGSWQAAGGGSGYPHQYSRGEQIAVAENLLDMQGWSAWPSCAAALGLPT